MFRITPHLSLLLCLLMAIPALIAASPPGIESPSSPSSLCCFGPSRGDMNFDGNEADPTDLAYLVDYLFAGGSPLICDEEADINADGIPGDPVDLSFLVDYLFAGGPDPATCPPSIRILGLKPGDATVSGDADNVNFSTHQVVLWAKTDRWYIQPSVVAPYTPISGSGNWSNSTNPWDRIVALLVDASYVPTDILSYHPASDPGVVAWDEYPFKDPDRFIEWSGYTWRVKDGGPIDPGPNYFSDDTLSVWVDPSDRLHLTTDFRDGQWQCSEIILNQPLGYGIYTYKLDSRADNLNYNVTFSGFLYEKINQEIDIEFSQVLADPFNCQFVVQPWYTPGNIVYFNLPASSQTTHQIDWSPDRVLFKSWNGHAGTPTPTTLINEWKYTGADNPTADFERMIFNLYLHFGDPPTGNTGDEVIVKSFDFAPQP